MLGLQHNSSFCLCVSATLALEQQQQKKTSGVQQTGKLACTPAVAEMPNFAFHREEPATLGLHMDRSNNLSHKPCWEVPAQAVAEP